MTTPRRIRRQRRRAKRPVVVIRVPGEYPSAAALAAIRGICIRAGVRAIVHDDRTEVTAL